LLKPKNLVGPRSNAMGEIPSAPVAGDNNSDENEVDDDDSTAITGKEYTPMQFWNYVDDYLDYIYTVPFAEIPDSATRERKIVWYDFTFWLLSIW
jgi:hypothetical protein